MHTAYIEANSKIFSNKVMDKRYLQMETNMSDSISKENPVVKEDISGSKEVITRATFEKERETGLEFGMTIREISTRGNSRTMRKMVEVNRYTRQDKDSKEYSRKVKK